MEFELNVQNRIKEVTLPDGTSKVKIGVSRSNCKDVLLEVIDQEGKAKGKPLEKWLPEIKSKSMKGLRFMMNDFSTKPIKITIDFK
ncbi:hypothetical protein [Carboxylicivirga linearis]|uniref:Uncharacterized protein n=1 Tax=Carboxylicivirga linearis TaxID=1628157 RepID=A0ABS5JYQ4_9BACT|nr:hypothetical protein [Carboxylicivirga linearis]MBS2099446.1 hypothetical protein [Carboxylicivirga linearis]